MSDGLWWRKVRRGIIRDDYLERVAYSLAPELRPQVLSWYVVAYMLADDDGVFDFEDGEIFALRCFSTVEAVTQIKNEMEKRGVITNVIGGHSSLYMINDWIEVEDSQYKTRPKVSADQRRAKVAQKIRQEREEKAAADETAKRCRKGISATKCAIPDDFSAMAPQMPEVPVEVLAARAQFFGAAPDSSTKCGEMSKHTQDSTETAQHRDSTGATQNSTTQYSTVQQSTGTNKSGAVAPELPSAVADGSINDKSDINYIEMSPYVQNSHYNAIFNGLTNYCKANMSKLDKVEQSRERVNIMQLSDNLSELVDKNNSGAIILSVFTSVVDAEFSKVKAILPSDLLKEDVFNFCKRKTCDILSLDKESG